MILNRICVVALIFSIFVAACSPTMSPPSSADSQAINVNEIASSTNTDAEEIYLNNCGNSANSQQTSTRSQTISLEGGADLGVSAEVVKASVEAKYVSTSNVTKSQTVTAAPNTNMKFVLLWTEQVNGGTITATSHSGQETYKVSVPISVEQSSAEDLGCPKIGSQSAQPVPQEATQVPTVVLPQASPTNPVSLDTPPGSILNVGEYWRQNNISLILDNSSFDMKRSCAGFDFDLTNNTDHDLILTIVLSQFAVKDNTGRIWKPRALSHYVYCGDPGPWNDSQISTSIAPGKSFWDAAYSSWIVSFDGPLTDPKVTDLYVSANGLSQFTNATWDIPIGR
jgi:hypothetical protein